MAVKRTKVICKSEKGTQEDQDISTPTRNLARDRKSVGVGIEVYSNITNNSDESTK